MLHPIIVSEGRVRILLAAVGKLKAGPDRELFERYWGRLQVSGRQIGISGAKAVELPESRAAAPAERKADEADQGRDGREGHCKRRVLAPRSGIKEPGLEDQDNCAGSGEFIEQW